MTIKNLSVDLALGSGRNSWFGRLAWLLLNHTAHLVCMIRIGQSIRRTSIIGGPIGLFWEYVIRIVFSSDISCRAVIGPGLVIQHGHDIVIGADVKIGARCKIFNGVTLGNKDVSKSSAGSQPTVGDDSVLATGAKILGPVILGDRVTVGANAVVLNSFPSDAVVVGVPGRNVRATCEPSL